MHDTLTVYRPVRWSLPARGAPAQEPVSLEEMKAHVRAVAPDDTADLSSAIETARKWVERRTHRALITQTAVYKMDRFPDRQDTVIELPGGKLQSVTSIQYVDTDGATQTWATSEYDVDTDHEPGRVALAYLKDWPSVREWNLAVTITYVVGYGDDPGDVPNDLRHSIKILAAELYENREETVVGPQVMPLPWGAERLASGYSLPRII